MHYTPKEPIRINKSIAFKSVKERTEDAIPSIVIKGMASVMIDAAGDFKIDADNENINTMGIGLSRLKSGNLPLLYGHDQSKPVGKITSAAYKSDGLEIEAILYKLPGDELTNFVYESVKVGTLNSFSVGIIVEEFDMVEKGGTDYLQLSKSEMIETSIVAVPSNNDATFSVLSVKNAGSEKTSYKTIISTEDLKAENPNICGEFETCILESTKALNYEDTKQESWMTRRQFSVYLESLNETIIDNFDANRWDELSAEDLISNMEAAFVGFIADQRQLLNGKIDPETEADELNSALAHDGSFAFSDGSKSINGEDMHTKNTEEVKQEATEAPVVEPEVSEENPAEITKEEPEMVQAPEEEVKPEIQEPDAKAEEPEQTIPKVTRTADDFVVEAALLSANINDMDEADLEKYFNSAAALTSAIEEFVKDSIKNEAAAQRA